MDQILGLGKITASFINAPNENMMKPQEPHLKMYLLFEHHQEQVQISCITLWNQNLYLCLSLCESARYTYKRIFY